MEEAIMDKMIKACSQAEQKILEYFVTNVALPDKAGCEEAISFKQTNEYYLEILAQFGHAQYGALADMWENVFSEDSVKRHDHMGNMDCKIMFTYAVNRIFRKLVAEYPQFAKNKKIQYKGEKEEVDAAIVLTMVNKTHIWPVWGIQN